MLPSSTNCSGEPQTVVAMTEPDDDSALVPDDLESLEILKEAGDAADTSSVEDGIGPGTRWNWNPVTDSGGSPRVEDEAVDKDSGFQFDLGGALARLANGEPPEPRKAPQPATQPVPEFKSAPVFKPGPAADPAPAVEVSSPSSGGATPMQSGRVMPDPIPDFDDQPLPRRSRFRSSGGADTPVASPQVPEFGPIAAPEPLAEQPLPTRSSTHGSIFGGTPAPVLPPRSTPITPPTDRAPSAYRIAPVTPPVTGALPTLPAANPVAPPPLVAPIDTAPSTPDINALRSAQLRVDRQQRQGKVFGRSLLAFVAIGALLAAALIYGPSYLFPTEWDAALTPIVDDIQETTGIEFDHTIPLIVQPNDEYAAGLLESTLGSGWVTSVSEWRALGLANGDVTAPTVAAQLANRQAAYFDPGADSIFQAEGQPEEEIGPALENALLAAFQHQLRAPVDGVVETSASGLTGVSPTRTLARRAVDAYLIRRTVGEVFTPTAEVATEADLPTPIAYELAAVERLGESILTAAGIDPAALQLGAAYPDAIYGVLGDSPISAPSVPLQAGEQPLADAIALGIDDWSLVWGSQLPAVTADRLATIVTSDSYRPIDRNGTTCFVAVLQTATEANGASLFSAMQLWALRVPVGSHALTTRLGPARVQLEACDPGAGTLITTSTDTVDGLIAQQSERLGG